MLLQNPQYNLLLRLGKPMFYIKKEIEVPILEPSLGTSLTTKPTTIPLYPHQMEVFEQLTTQPIALIQAKMGWGKSILACAISQLEPRTLIVLHRNIMIKQFIAEFKKFSPDTNVSVHADGKKDMSGEVVLTSFATFRKKYAEFTGFNTLIVDEVDEFFSDKSIKAMVEFEATRKYGMTGTIRTRFDECNKMKVLPMFFNNTMIEGVTTDDSNVLDKVYYYVHNGTYKDDRGAYVQVGDWIEFRKALDANKTRKNAQLRFILDNSTDKESTLLLFDRVSDSKAFYKVMQARNIKCNIVTGERTDRDDQIKDFKEKDGYLIGTMSIFQRGFNHPPLQKVFIMFPSGGGNAFEQTVGRVVREFNDQKGYVYIWEERQLHYQIENQKEIIKQSFGKTMTEIQNNRLKL